MAEQAAAIAAEEKAEEEEEEEEEESGKQAEGEALAAQAATGASAYNRYCAHGNCR